MSRLLIKDTGTPDGDYEADIYNDTTKILISTIDVTFLNDEATVNLVGEAAVVNTLIVVKGVNQPETGFAKFLSSEVTAPPEAIVTFSEVNQPLTKSLSHDLADKILALFVVDSANNVITDLVTGLTQPVTTAVAGTDDLTTFKEQVSFTNLFTLSTYNNLSMVVIGDISTAYGKEVGVRLTPTEPLETLSLMIDNHWDTGGYTQIDNVWQKLGSITLSPHEGLSSVAMSVGTVTSSLYNDGVVVDSEPTALRDITTTDDNITVTVGGSVSSLKLIAVLSVALEENQLTTLLQDSFNLLDNTGNGLSIPPSEGSEVAPEPDPEVDPETPPVGSPPPASTIVLSATPVDGLYRDEARKTLISDSHANSSEFYDALNANIVGSNLATGDYTEWYVYFLHGRVNALLTAYFINNDVTYLNQAKDAYLYRYVTQKWEGQYDSYTGRNNFRSEGASSMMLSTQLAPFFTAQENADIQVEIAKWANFWLDYFDYDNSFAAARWKDTDETTAFCEAFLVFSMTITDEALAAKCLSTFQFLYHEVDEYLIKGVCSSGFWCESTPYNANTTKNYLRMRLLADEFTDLPSQQGFVNLLWDSYVQQYLDTDTTHIWWQGDVENQDEAYCDQTESRYISFYDTIIALLKGSYREAECAYFRSLLDDSANDYDGAIRVRFQDSRVQGVKPLLLPLYKKSARGMGIQVMRNSWDIGNTVITMFNHASLVDHNQKEPLGFNLFHKGKPVTKQMTAYDEIPPFNGCYLEGHNSNRQASSSYVYGSPVQYDTFSDGTYAYTCGDTKDTFNQVGYKKTVICSQFSRAMFVDYASKTVIIYDHIVTDPNVNSDMLSEPVTPWARKVERHHRFINPLVAPTLSAGIYSGELDGIVQHYEPLLTLDSVELIEESTHADYADRPAHTFRVNQAAYQVREHIQSSDAELMSLLTYGETGQVAATHEPVTVGTGNVIGTMINGSNVILFNRQPQLPFAGTIEFTVADASLISSIYVLGVDSALSYDKTVVGNTVTLSAGGATAVNTSSVLVI
jgi:hypothetical protein